MTVVVITPPTAPLIDVPTARARLALDASISDLTIQANIAAALGMLDGPAGTLGRAILPQTLEWRSANWAPRHDFDWRGGHLHSLGYSGGWHWRHHRAIELAFPPVTAVTSITYLDQTGTQQTLPASAYQVDLDGDEARVRPVFGTTWPPALMVPDSVRIRYAAGYQDADDNPSPPPGLVQAILMMARSLGSLSTRDGALRGEQVTGIGSTSYDTGASAGAGLASAVEALIAPYRVPSL